MPGFFPGRPGGEHDEPLLDMIFDRRPIPPGAPPEMRVLEQRLAALAGPAEPSELAGEAAALAAFARRASPVGISRAATRPARHRLPRRPARGRLALAAALVAAAAGLGSATAAYQGVLPGPIQQMAHVTVGAPAPRHPGSPHSPGGSRARSGAHQPPGSAVLTQPSSANRDTVGGPAPVSGPRIWPPRHSPRPTRTCPPTPYPTQNPEGQGSGVPSWAPPSQGAAGCVSVAIPTPHGAAIQTAGPGQGH